ASHEIEPEGMKCADPHCGGCGRIVSANSFGEFARGFVREGQDEDFARIYFFGEQTFDSRGERLRLARSWTRFEQVCVTAVLGGVALLIVQCWRRLSLFCLCLEGRQ